VPIFTVFGLPEFLCVVDEEASFGNFLIVFIVEHLSQLSFGFFNDLALIVKGHDDLIIGKEIS
jgi:hypothetical protein